MITRAGLLIFTMAFIFCANTFADQKPAQSAEDKAFAERAEYIRNACRERSLPENVSRVDCRILHERDAIAVSNTLIPHKQNYILFYAYEENPNEDTWIGYEGDPENGEVVFQISFKYPLWVQEKNTPDRFSAFIGFTQKSFWQLYNKRNSSPFRETNYQPELLLNYLPLRKFWGVEIPLMTLGINHQSNGQSEPKSRSWNRIYLETIFAKGNFALSIRPWYRLPESRAEDDNRHILDYYGRGDLTFAYSNNLYQASMLLRNNLYGGDENRGAVQLDLGFPIAFLPKFQFYVQVFHGYGESLIDYNYSSTRVGVGVLTTNWL